MGPGGRPGEAALRLRRNPIFKPCTSRAILEPVEAMGKPNIQIMYSQTKLSGKGERKTGRREFGGVRGCGKMERERKGKGREEG